MRATRSPGAAPILLLLAGACQKHVTPSVYEVPEGLTGWVTMQFDVPGAPPLPRDQGQRVFRIPPSGKLVTSSPQELGSLHQTFYLLDVQGRRTLLEDVSARAGEGARTFDKPVVCCFQTGDKTVQGKRSVYEGFYVGKAPAQGLRTAPEWP